jgi:hypothetical protein
MSGYPTKELIKEFATHLERVAEHAREIETLKATIGRDQIHLNKLVDAWTVSKNSMLSCLKRMDISNELNFGWECRSTQFFTDLLNELTEDRS